MRKKKKCTVCPIEQNMAMLFRISGVRSLSILKRKFQVLLLGKPRIWVGGQTSINNSLFFKIFFWIFDRFLKYFAKFTKLKNSVFYPRSNSRKKNRFFTLLEKFYHLAGDKKLNVWEKWIFAKKYKKITWAVEYGR